MSCGVYLHALELRGELGAGELELLDDVGDLLEAVRVAVLPPLAVGHHQERRALEQQHLHTYSHTYTQSQTKHVPNSFPKKSGVSQVGSNYFFTIFKKRVVISLYKIVELTSSASTIAANCFKDDSRAFTLGINLYTMLDHALEKDNEI